MTALSRRIPEPAVLALFAALILLTFTSVGVTTLISLLGILLCLVGVTQRSARIDWWILVPLAVYVVMNMVSSYMTYQSIAIGYGPVQLVWVTIYILSCCLSAKGTSLLRALCVLWAAVVAVIGIVAFAASSFFVSVTRLEYVLGTPNSLGIFMVLGWFALTSCRWDESASGRLNALLPHLEPLILAALALTLSMGSMASLVVGIIVMMAGRKRGRTWRQVCHEAAITLAKVVLGIGVGLLMYLAAERAEAPVLCVILVVYLALMAILWPRFERFLSKSRAASLLLLLAGILCAILALVMRPGSVFTFAERLQMMANGIGYLDDKPLTGVGPMQWRLLNIDDADIYYSTNHIHNVFIHAGVEFGIIAMVALIVIAVRCFVKRYRQAQHGEDAAFLFNLLTDTGFFFVGVTSMFMLTANGSVTQAKELPRVDTVVLFVALGILHAFALFSYLSVR